MVSHATPKVMARRRAKAGRYAPGKDRAKVMVSLYIDPNLLARLNEAWLSSDCPFFSRWAAQKLEDAIK